MGLPGQQAFAYQHKAFTSGNLDKGKYVEKFRCMVVVEHQDTFDVVQTQHSLVDQDLGKLVGDQTQKRLVDQVQDDVGIVGIAVVDIGAIKDVEVAIVVVDTMVVD